MKTRPLQTFLVNVGALSLVTLVHGDSAVAQAPLDRFVVGGETIQDTMTGLVWERFATPDPTDWDNAKNRCARLAFGTGSFRLPAPNELLTIIDVSAEYPAVDRGVFADVGPNDSYWTVAKMVAFPDTAWVVYVAWGDSYGPVDPNESGSYRARCVASR